MVTAKAAQSKKTVACICINCKDKPKFRGPGLLAERNSAVSSVNVSMNHHMSFILFY